MNKTYFADEIKEDAVHKICEHVRNTCNELQSIKIISTEIMNGFMITLPEKYRNFSTNKNEIIKAILVYPYGDKNIEGSDPSFVFLKYETDEYISIHEYNFYKLVELSDTVDKIKEDFNNSFFVSTSI